MPPLRETLKKIIWNSLAPFHYTSTSFQRLDSLGVFFFCFYVMFFNVNEVQNVLLQTGRNLGCCINNQDQANNDQDDDVVLCGINRQPFYLVFMEVFFCRCYPSVDPPVSVTSSVKPAAAFHVKASQRIAIDPLVELSTAANLELFR